MLKSNFNYNATAGLVKAWPRVKGPQVEPNVYLISIPCRIKMVSITSITVLLDNNIL